LFVAVLGYTATFVLFGVILLVLGGAGIVKKKEWKL
jgi:hypothetical protein